jgi:hypothetical protein
VTCAPHSSKCRQESRRRADPSRRRATGRHATRAKRERGIGDAAGYDDVGVLIERLHDWLGAKINIRGNDLAPLRKTGAADFAGGEIGRRKPGYYVVAFDNGNARHAQAEWIAPSPLCGAPPPADWRPPKLPTILMPDERHRARTGGSSRSSAGL